MARRTRYRRGAGHLTRRAFRSCLYDHAHLSVSDNQLSGTVFFPRGKHLDISARRFEVKHLLLESEMFA